MEIIEKKDNKYIGKVSGKKTATNKEINAGQKDAKEAKKIIQALISIEAYMGAGDFVNVRKLAVVLELTGSLETEMNKLNLINNGTNKI